MSESERLTLAIVNAKVWTGDSARPWADGIGVRGDTIVLVGSSAAVRKVAGEAEIIDAGGQMVVPGFIDSHVHFVDGGFRLSSVQLRDAATPAGFIERVRAFAATVPAGTWIQGGDWDHTNWGGELPTAAWIDSVTPDHPVMVNRLDGHMILANSAALRAAGVSRTTENVAGGEIVRDRQGEPTGILKDNAMGLVMSVVPQAPPELEDRALDAAMAYVAAQGVTSVHNMGSFNDLAVFRRAQAANRLSTRIYANVPLENWAQLRDTVAASGRGDKWLSIGGLKGFVDGSLGSHTAAMERPYSDAPRDMGLFVTTPDALYEMTSAADKAGLQVMVHAIGDKAIRIQLDVFERVAQENGARDRRFRIEHAQHIGANDLTRFGALGVVASMQPYHAIDDGRWADPLIGADRASRTYAFRSLLDAGAVLAFGSDWFVAPPTPLMGIHAAVTRRTLDGKNRGGWIPAQKIGVEEALKAYTYGGAFASFMDGDRGTIAVGKLADFAFIDHDLTRTPTDSLASAKVTRTIVGGKTVFPR